MQLDRVCCPKTGQTKLSGEDRAERVTFTSTVLHQEDVTAMEKLVPLIMGWSFAVKTDNFQGHFKKWPEPPLQVLDRQQPYISAQKEPSTLNAQQLGCAGLPTHPPETFPCSNCTGTWYLPCSGEPSPNPTVMEQCWHHLQTYSQDKLLTPQTKTGIFLLNEPSWLLLTELLAS